MEEMEEMEEKDDETLEREDTVLDEVHKMYAAAGRPLADDTLRPVAESLARDLRCPTADIRKLFARCATRFELPTRRNLEITLSEMRAESVSDGDSPELLPDDRARSCEIWIRASASRMAAAFCASHGMEGDYIKATERRRDNGLLVRPALFVKLRQRMRAAGYAYPADFIDTAKRMRSGAYGGDDITLAEYVRRTGDTRLISSNAHKLIGEAGR